MARLDAPLKCGGKCGKPGCTFEVRDTNASRANLRMSGHVHGSKKGAEARAAKAAARVGGEAPSQGAPFTYPRLADVPTQPPGTISTTASPPSPPVTPPTIPLLTAEAIKSLCDMADAVAEKAMGRRIYNMTMPRAQVVEASLRALPFQSSMPTAPIIVPWYIPVLFTVFPILVLPPVLALAEWAMTRRKDKKEGRGGRESGPQGTPGERFDSPETPRGEPTAAQPAPSSTPDIPAVSEERRARQSYRSPQ